MDDPRAKAALILILNIVMPGLGGLVYSVWFQRDRQVWIRALIQLCLFWFSVIMASCNKYLYFIIIAVFVVWIWAIVEGIEIYRHSQG
ncbi:MAG: hypothetical protein ACP5QG_05050 [candidate division WOR-3 bacterium]